MKVFKYRSLSKGAVWDTLRALARNRIYSAPLEKLNDPFEARVEINDESFKISRALNLLPGIRLMDNIPGTEQQFLSELGKFVDKTKTFGIYSLSKSCTDELLWAYYADSHKGFCIEYDLETLLDYKLHDGVVVEVQYEPNIPVVTLNDLLRLDGDDIKPLLIKLVGTKCKRWEHEEEIRIVTGQTGLIEYDFRAVKGIYFGYRCDNRFQASVMKILQGRDVSYFRLTPSNGSYNPTRRSRNQKVAERGCGLG